MADAEGRLWGWDAAFEDNCAFKDPSSGNPVSITVGPPVAGQIAVDNGPQLSPSAAGTFVMLGMSYGTVAGLL